MTNPNTQHPHAIQHPTPDATAPEAPASEAETAAAAQLAQTLDALQAGRAGRDRLPAVADDSDLPALASLGLLLQSVELSQTRQAQVQADVWQRIEQRLTGRALRTPERPMTWWRWLWVAIPSVAVLLLVVSLTSNQPPAPSPLKEGGAPHAETQAPDAVAALDRQQAAYAQRLQANPQAPPSDTALRDYRHARLSAWQTDLLWSRRAGATRRAEVRRP